MELNNDWMFFYFTSGIIYAVILIIVLNIGLILSGNFQISEIIVFFLFSFIMGFLTIYAWGAGIPIMIFVHYVDFSKDYTLVELLPNYLVILVIVILVSTFSAIYTRNEGFQDKLMPLLPKFVHNEIINYRKIKEYKSKRMIKTSSKPIENEICVCEKPSPHEKYSNICTNCLDKIIVQ